ncbi:twin-arginine translocase TatA/TatE family subunit [Candidatus Latescibacterota bacterium]
MLETGYVELAFIGGLGPMELMVIFLIVLLVFGAKRIPEIAQGLGKGITEFKKAAREITNEFDVNNAQPKTTQNVRNELKDQSPETQPQQTPSQPKQSDSTQV